MMLSVRPLLLFVLQESALRVLYFLAKRATAKDVLAHSFLRSLQCFWTSFESSLSLYFPCFEILKALDGASLKRLLLPGWPTVCLCFPMCHLAPSGCQQLELDNLMARYKFINASHSWPSGIMYCDFKDIGKLVNIVAKHDREWNALITVYGSQNTLFHYDSQRPFVCPSDQATSGLEHCCRCFNRYII